MPRPPTRKKMIETARRIYQEEGSIEIDDNAKVSRGEGNPDKGAYVQAWLWVYDESAKENKNP